MAHYAHRNGPRKQKKCFVEPGHHLGRVYAKIPGSRSVPDKRRNRPFEAHLRLMRLIAQVDADLSPKPPTRAQ